MGAVCPEREKFCSQKTPTMACTLAPEITEGLMPNFFKAYKIPRCAMHLVTTPFKTTPVL